MTAEDVEVVAGDESAHRMADVDDLGVGHDLLPAREFFPHGLGEPGRVDDVRKPPVVWKGD
jgi:hypothetical protein